MIGSADVAPASAAFRRGASSNAAEVPMNWRRDRFEQRRVYMAYVVTKPSLSLFCPLFKQENAASSARSASCRHHMPPLDSSFHEPRSSRREEAPTSFSRNRMSLLTSAATVQGFNARNLSGRLHRCNLLLHMRQKLVVMVHGSDVRSRCALRPGACVSRFLLLP